MISKNIFFEQFSALLQSREDSSFSGSFSRMLSSLDDRALTCLYGWHSELGSQTVIYQSVPESMQWLPWQNHVFFFLCGTTWWLKITVLPILIFSPLCKNMSPVSFNLLMILCAVDNRRLNVFATLCWRTLMGNCSTIWRCSFFVVCELLPNWTSERLCFFKVLFLYLIMLLTFCQLTWLVAISSSTVYF